MLRTQKLVPIMIEDDPDNSTCYIEFDVPAKRIIGIICHYENNGTEFFKDFTDVCHGVSSLEGGVPLFPRQHILNKILFGKDANAELLVQNGALKLELVVPTGFSSIHNVYCLFKD